MATIQDDFDRADAGTLGTATGTNGGFSWTEVSGGHTISGNFAVSANAGDLSRAESDLASNDHYAQAVVKSATPNNWGICARFAAAAQTFYLVQLVTGDTIQLYKCVAGSFTQLGASVGSLTFAVDDTIKLECIGTAIKGYQNGVERISSTDSDIPTGTRTGLRSGSTGLSYNDFKAEDIAVATTLDEDGEWIITTQSW